MNLICEMPQTGLREFLKASGIVVMFRLLDVKCAGKLSKEDFMEGLKVLGYAGDGSGAEAMFYAIDSDRDGVVTPHDFAAFFASDFEIPGSDSDSPPPACRDSPQAYSCSNHSSVTVSGNLPASTGEMNAISDVPGSPSSPSAPNPALEVNLLRLELRRMHAEQEEHHSSMLEELRSYLEEKMQSEIENAISETVGQQFSRNNPVQRLQTIPQDEELDVSASQDSLSLEVKLDSVRKQMDELVSMLNGGLTDEINLAKQSISILKGQHAEMKGSLDEFRESFSSYRADVEELKQTSAYLSTEVNELRTCRGRSLEILPKQFTPAVERCMSGQMSTTSTASSDSRHLTRSINPAPQVNPAWRQSASPSTRATMPALSSGRSSCGRWTAGGHLSPRAGYQQRSFSHFTPQTPEESCIRSCSPDGAVIYVPTSTDRTGSSGRLRSPTPSYSAVPMVRHSATPSLQTLSEVDSEDNRVQESLPSRRIIPPAVSTIGVQPGSLTVPQISSRKGSMTAPQAQSLFVQPANVHSTLTPQVKRLDSAPPLHGVV